MKYIAKTIAAAAFTLSCLFMGTNGARAAVIVGPSAFGTIGGNDTLWGIQFTALQNSILTSFNYNHRNNTFGNPFSGTVSLKNITDNVTVYSVVYGTNLPSVVPFTGLNITLDAGDIYQLVATSTIVSGANDEVWQYVSLNSPVITYPVSNAHISVTKGVFNNNPGFQVGAAWGAFTNITTQNAVPEPGTYAMAASFSLVGALILRRKRALK